MGISPVKSYYQLLKEKVGIEEPEKVDNPYVDYGNVMEEKIRDYINKELNVNFAEDKLINGDIRCHVDGFNGQQILEIKTTSRIHKRVKTYKYYIVQLLFYMINYQIKDGILAVYERPKDFDTEFDVTRLTEYSINIDEYQDWVEEINQAVDKFRVDKKRLEENVLLGEEDFK
jgi:hypothetical protein